MNLKPHFSRFLSSSPGRLHFAAHSHHPWPDVSYDAHQQAWLDAASLADDKWDRVFGVVLPETAREVAALLGLDDPSTLTFGPNTHDFLVRIFSCWPPPVRILTTDAEFHSFSRQTRRWEEAGLAVVERVSAEPFDSFPDRFTTVARNGGHDLVYLSSVFFDSGFVVPDLDRIVASVPENRTFIVIDAYHSFMARPSPMSAIQDRAFVMAGGYKYAMSGEGACFLHAPPGYGPRPVDTGWYAGFDTLESSPKSDVGFAEGGSRFAGATYDPSGLYRMRSVLGWIRGLGLSPTDIHDHARELQSRFLEAAVAPGELVPGTSHPRGNFLTFRTGEAGNVYRDLHHRGVITDYRGDRLRIGFGVYQDDADVDLLVEAVAAVRRN